MRIVRIVLFSLLAVGLLVIIYALFGNYSSGSRAGTVAKFRSKGVVFKTLEGQLNVGAFSNQEGSYAPEIWNFSVHGGQDEVINQLEDALLEGYRVKLYYHEKFFRFFWQGDSKYYVYKVEQVRKPATAPVAE